eukprot:788189-Amphidinium_carterae.1
MASGKPHSGFPHTGCSILYHRYPVGFIRRVVDPTSMQNSGYYVQLANIDHSWNSKRLNIGSLDR